MFIEDIVELVNKFNRSGINEFKVEFHDGHLTIQTLDNVDIKYREGTRIGPMVQIGNEYVTQVNLNSSDFLADGKVYHTAYWYDADKQDIREIVREEIEKFVEEHYRNRLTLVEATVREEIDKYLEAKFDGRIVLK